MSSTMADYLVQLQLNGQLQEVKVRASSWTVALRRGADAAERAGAQVPRFGPELQLSIKRVS